jgi:HEAT repeat protein
VALLSKLYGSATDRRIKEKVLQSFLIADQKGLVFEAARTEKDPELRKRAIELLGAMEGTDELRQLYRAETDVDVKRKVLEGLFVAGDVETLSTVARSETNRELRRKAIESLGVTDSERAAAELKDIYRRETEPDLKEAVLNAFFVQDNPEALIEVAKTEKDPALRRAALQKLSLMDSPAATEFLLKHLQ